MYPQGDADHARLLRALYLGVLGREPDPAGLQYFMNRLRAAPDAIEAVAAEFFTSAEHRQKARLIASRAPNETPRFRAPAQLRQSPTPPLRALVIGSCLSEMIRDDIGRVIPGASADHMIHNLGEELPERPPHPVADYAFQLIIPPLRCVMPEALLARVAWDDTAGFERGFAHSERVLVQLLEGALAYNARHGLTSFVANFLTTQANPMGRFFAGNDIRNPARYVRRLNDLLAEFCAGRTGVHVLDIDEIAAQIGRRLIQDDALWMSSHATFLFDFDHAYDHARLHRPPPVSRALGLAVDEFRLAIWAEAEAMLRTVQQQDSVKLVICDLDDTLWRGVIAEEGIGNPELIEGWPLGVIEALQWLRRRGILLAIVSKNDEARIRELWPHFMELHLPLEHFCSIRINWRPKSENVGEILRDCNLLARSAVFIDDNPVEREGVQQAHPGIRVLGADLYAIRRTLLWSPETQITTVTAETARRTEMIQTQIARERVREAMPREAFLASLDVLVRRMTITDNAHPRFARAFELVNKSNQFNTTGERWSTEQAHRFLAAGGRLEAIDVRDKFSQYGLVGVAVVEGDLLRQFVMSCRALGLEAEIAFLLTLAGEISDREGQVRGRIVTTDANFLARDLFARLGFRETAPGVWLGPADPRPPIPAHVTLATAELLPA